MATQRAQAIPLDDYPVGSQSFGPFSLRANDIHFYLELRRSTSADPTIWPNVSTGVKVDLEVSRDAGSTWEYGGGFTAVGGIHTRINGAQASVSALNVPLPPQGGTQRRIRGTVEITGGPLRTEGFVELRDS